MENIFKISKRGIIATLVLCILLGIAGTCLNVTAMAEENTEETAVATEEITTVVVEESTIFTEKPIVATEETTPELMPMMASGCENDYNHIFGNPEHNLDGFVGYYGGNQAAAYAAVSVAAQAYVTSHQINRWLYPLYS